MYKLLKNNLLSTLESQVCGTLDLSGQSLKKLSRCPSDADISTLIIDDNDLQRLDNLDSYHRITKVVHANLHEEYCLSVYEMYSFIIGYNELSISIHLSF